MTIRRNIKKHFSISSIGSLVAHTCLFLFVLGSFRPITVKAAPREITVTGQTMGTIYQVKVITENRFKAAHLKKKIDDRLKVINQSMSTYIAHSEISRFNDQAQIGNGVEVSSDFWAVMGVAKRIYVLTEGAWDGTLAPLINLWGFGSKKSTDRVPSETEIEALKTFIGFDLIDMSTDRQLIKKEAAVTLDLASIAKGYGVDAVAELLQTMDFNRYLVEIGGETYAVGRRLDGQLWRVGINRPERNAPFDAVYKVVPLSGRALATSGDYRNYFEANGKFYSHVLDPRTGYPVANGVVAVSVLADNCTLADGLATGIMVMGVDKGLALIHRLDRVEGLIITRTKEGHLEDHPSKGFDAEKY